MIFFQPSSPPLTEHELMLRCQRLEGLTFSQLAMSINRPLELSPAQRKGWVGQAIEQFLGASAANHSLPDFMELGIELKTIPLAANGKPAESTFVTTIPLLTIAQQRWETSQCFQKLKRVLWVPIEGDNDIPYPQRRIGRAILWSPTPQQETLLAADWNHLTELIATGHLEEIDSTVGCYLQIRPKAANGRALCFSYDSQGNKIKTLPRGFYLRTILTTIILNSHGT